MGCLSSLISVHLTGPLYRKVERLPLTKDIITISYNLALLHERMGHYEAAIELHKAILTKHPTYIDCYLRLGYLAKDSGHYGEANKWFKHVRVIGESIKFDIFMICILQFVCWYCSSLHTSLSGDSAGPSILIGPQPTKHPTFKK